MAIRYPGRYPGPAYLIRSENDPVFKVLTDEEVARMVIGRMPSRIIDGEFRHISIANDELLESLRKKYYYKEGNLYRRK